MRIAAAVLLLAVVCLTASSLVWLRATNRSSALADGASGAAMLEELESTTSRVATPDVDVAARYMGRAELLDSRLALPTWHKHLRDDAARVHLSAKQCPPVALPSAFADASLGKAYAWHERTRAGGAPSDDLVDRPPFMHPSATSSHGRVSATGWFYLAGGWNGKSHWQKSILKNDVLYTLRYELDPNQNLSFDPIVVRGLLSFKAP